MVRYLDRYRALADLELARRRPPTLGPRSSRMLWRAKTRDALASPSGDLSHACYAWPVAKKLTQRQLRNESGEIMRALDAGESFVVTRNGVAVGELKPVQRHRFIARDAAVEAFGRAAPLDAELFRADLDRHTDQDPTPRG
jgi:antitoxin (DNA-binding transcriptional repressor) of toxin-antitoxin stability system